MFQRISKSDIFTHDVTYFFTDLAQDVRTTCWYAINVTNILRETREMVEEGQLSEKDQEKR